MIVPYRFIGRSREYATETKNVPAPYLRKDFFVPKEEKEIFLNVCCVGLYEVYINGRNITKGFLSPYLSNPNHIVYCDRYDIRPYVSGGKNCVGLLLGNGSANVAKTFVWDMNSMPWRSAPKVALVIECGGKEILSSDGAFKTHDSPLLFDELRAGEIFDARRETEGWSLPDFCDEAWDNAIEAEPPRGDIRLSDGVTPILPVKERQPIAITKTKKGYLFDFGYNTAGIFRMSLRNTVSGQRVRMRAGEWKTHGALNQVSNKMNGKQPSQEYIYICKGAETETYGPRFSYCGYRYIEIDGIRKDQAATETLTAVEAHTALKKVGDFRCSSDVLNRIQQATVNSDRSNFFHYPTDCPTREKNGWTGDASVSCEQMLLNIDCGGALKEWLAHARKAQREDGSLPTILPLLTPTGNWGYASGAVWDSFLPVLCYRVYQYTGDKEILTENADALFRYLQYLSSRRDERGLLTKGLSDWVQPHRDAAVADSPNEVGLTFLARESCRMAKEIFTLLGQKERADFAERTENELYRSVRKHLLFGDTVEGECLTSQALGIFYRAFTEEELPKARAKLIKIAKSYDNAFAVGMVGTRILPTVLTESGRTDFGVLSFKYSCKTP